MSSTGASGAARSTSRATTTPTTPSYFPPVGTESMWDPHSQAVSPTQRARPRVDVARRVDARRAARRPRPAPIT